MMASDAQNLLSLVRSALWSVPAVDLPDDVNWERVISLASRQTLLGLVADAVGYLQEDRHPPKSIMTRLFARRAASIRAHALINRRLGQVQELLCEKGLRPVLLKGQGLAMNYPDSLARQCGDIDRTQRDLNAARWIDPLQKGGQKRPRYGTAQRITK